MNFNEIINEMTGLTSASTWVWHGKPLSLIKPEASWHRIDLLIFDCPDSVFHSTPLSLMSQYCIKCKQYFNQMSLEEKILWRGMEVIDYSSPNLWQGHPLSHTTEDDIYEAFKLMDTHLYADGISPVDKRIVAKRNHTCFLQVDRLIAATPDSVALTSHLPYIRDYKKWLIKNT